MTQQPNSDTIQNAAYLTNEQKSLASDLYKTAVSPLDEFYGKQVTGTIEDLSRRGVLYGGLGSGALKDLAVEQGRQRANISGQIATSLGQTALEQAYNSNEAARARQFAASESTKAQEFTGTQNEASRKLQELLSAKQIEAAQLSQSSAQQFTGGQNEAARTLQQQLATQSIEAQKSSQESSQQFTGTQNEASRTLQQQLATQSIEANKANQASEQQFQLAFQNAGFIQQDKLADRQAQAQNNAMALQLALDGNLGGEAVQQIVEKTFGKGLKFSTNDEVDLKRVAAATGLTVEEFTNVRSSLAKGQIADMFKDTREFIDQQVQGIVGYRSDIVGWEGVDNDKPIYGQVPIYGPTTQKVKNPNYGKDYVDANGNKTINPDYIQNPEKARQFQLQLAKLYTDAQIKSAEASSDSGSVICTELYRQGKLPVEIYIADSLYAKLIDAATIVGYHIWAVPLTKVMKRSKIITKIVTPFGRAWAYHMAYLIGVTKKPNYFGMIIEMIGMPICRFIGNLKGKKNA